MPATDDELFQQYRQTADPACFRILMRRLRPIWLGIATRVGIPVSDTDDVLQEIAVMLHRQQKQWDPARPWRNWAYCVARNAAIDYGRRLTRQRRASSVDVAQYFWLDTGLSPDQQAEENEREELLHQALAALSQPHRVLVHSLYFRGMKYQEVADAEQIPLGTVKSRHFQMILSLRKLLHGKDLV
jgi:RNA polymerase sigma-70 factor (ECF subfamily)